MKLWRCAPFELSLDIWGYDLAGDALEVSATHSEGRTEESFGLGTGRWDRMGLDLAVRLFRGEGLVEPPLWWALPHVVEAVLKRRLPDPGLPRG